jgi:S-adenosyl methyltransferase
MEPFDTAKPNIARVWDYWLGGKDNFAADRGLAQKMLVLHFVDASAAQQIATAFTRAIPAGSYVIISVGTGEDNAAARDYRAAYTAATLYFHRPGQIMSFFDGLELVPPGVVPVRGWEGDGPLPVLEPRQGSFLGGVGRKRA